uniref:KIB1-4 beta-propeller domain-containing protein n=1 Tax=Oryza punctata TaxID=4537 RepID=A0A0E0JZ30_ORYPU
MAWAELPEECVAGILHHLLCLPDHSMFSGVCTRWRTIATRHLPPMQPWLFMPSTTATSFFCVACEHTHQGPRLPDNARGARFCGAYLEGWVVAAEIPNDDRSVPWNRGPALLNLCTGEQVLLPRHLRNNNPNVTTINHIQAVILSNTPSQAHPYYAAAIVSGKPNIMFWRPGMNEWAPPMLKWDSGFKMWQKQLSKDPIEDAKYIVFGPLGGGFYVLNNKEDLLVYTPKANDKHDELTMSSVEKYQVRRNPRQTTPGPGEVLARYLVLSCRGHLLMVVRFVSTEKATVEFDVFKLELKPPSWKKLTLDTLTDQTIFLVRGCSFAVEMKKSCQCPPNIYFLDDSARFNGAGTSTSQAQQVEGPFPSGDTGRCCEQGIVRCLPREPPSDSSPWTWLYLPPYEALRRKWFMEQLVKRAEQRRLQEHQDG